MQTEWLWLLVSTLFFLGGFAYVAISLRTGRYHPSPLNLCIMAGGFICQCMFLSLRGQATGRCPITNPYEILVFVAWSAVLLYFILGRTFRLSLLGAFTAPLVSVFQLIALPNLRTPAVRQPVSDYWLEMHASISLLAYGAFALACIAGVMFLVQEHFLKHAKLQSLSYNLPPVTNLATAIVRVIAIGVLLLTLGVLSGFGAKTHPSTFHLLLSFAVWMLYVSILVMKLWRGLPSSQTAKAAVGAFLLPIATLMMMNH